MGNSELKETPNLLGSFRVAPRLPSGMVGKFF